MPPQEIQGLHRSGGEFVNLSIYQEHVVQVGVCKSEYKAVCISVFVHTEENIQIHTWSMLFRWEFVYLQARPLKTLLPSKAHREVDLHNRGRV